MTIKDKKFNDALLLGAQLLIDHGLGDWKVGAHNKRRVLADCNNRAKTIRYSKNFLTIATREDFIGVTLHEIAHALVGPGHGHDNVFKRKVLEISPNADYSGANVAKPVSTHKYDLVCPECGTKSRSNVNKRYACSKCTTYEKRVPFIVTENILQVVAW